jgi:hypothetical protein
MVKYSEAIVAYLPQAGYTPSKVLSHFEGVPVVMLLEKKRRYWQRLLVKSDETNAESGEPTVTTYEKVRHYYYLAKWHGKKSCLCPCMPACNNNPHEDEDWSTDDEEGERDFYGNGRTPNHYEKLGQQCLRTGQITSARKDLDPEDWGPVDPAEYEPTEMDHDDHPWSELEDDVPACGFCKVKPCLWTTHKTEVLAYVDQTWEGEEEHLDDIDLTTEQRGNKRKLAYAFASRLINGFLGRGNRKRHAWCVEGGIKAAYPDPKGEEVGYHSS